MVHSDQFCNYITEFTQKVLKVSCLYNQGHNSILLHTVINMIIARLTVSGESQLSASHISIISIPEVITHSTPFLIHADLNPTLGGVGSRACQSDCTCCTASCIQTQKVRKLTKEISQYALELM